MWNEMERPRRDVVPGEKHWLGASGVERDSTVRECVGDGTMPELTTPQQEPASFTDPHVAVENS